MTRVRFSLDDIEKVKEAISLSGLNGKHFVEIEHGKHAHSKKNLIQIAAHNGDAKSTLYELAAQGFHLYKADENSSWLVAQDKVADLWHRVRQGELKLQIQDFYTQLQAILIPHVANHCLLFFPQWLTISTSHL
ncbi:hypothetical protein [Glutamicibacter sp. AOP5-A2-18]|uniref:hypothetical protein n=1 Tax=Glutamicibacter sp. AOP5-A2-18 TaxID=3457656 RepID=UPI004033E6A9